MARIKIVEGTFPKQRAAYVPVSFLSREAYFLIKTAFVGSSKYHLRDDIASVDTVIAHKKKPTVKIVMRDGRFAIAQISKEIHEAVQIAIAARRSEPTPPRSQAFNPLPQSKTTQAGIPRVMKIFIGIPVGIVVLMMLLGFCHDDNGTGHPVAPPVVTPEMTAQLQKVTADQFAAKRSTLLANLKAAKTLEEYGNAVADAYPYAGIADTEFAVAYTDAKAVRDKQTTEREAAQNAKVQAESVNAAARAAIAAIRNFTAFLDGAEKDLRDGRVASASLEEIKSFLVVIEGMATALDDARHEKSHMPKTDITYLKGVEARLSSFQQKAFPKLRTAMVKAAGQTLWQHDVTVRAIGGGTIEFSGYWFSSNAMKQSTQEQLQSILTQLRFKQARYTPYQGAAYTYYKMDTPPDAKLMLFDSSSHQPMACTPSCDVN